MKYQNVKLFQKHLETAAPHGLSRVYLVGVADDFERKRWVGALVSLLAAPDEPRNDLSAVDSTIFELLTEMASPSLFASEPVTVIDELEKLNKKEAAQLADLVSRSEFSGYLILGARSKGPLFSVVEKKGTLLDLLDEKIWEKEKRLSEQLFEKARQAGKRLFPDALQLLLERVDKDAALLEKEIDKLICFTGERPNIEVSDVHKISASSRTHTLWQMAEEIVWEGKCLEKVDEGIFHGLVPAVRSQLQLGLKIASFLDAKVGYSEMSERIPKVWPKLLEKRVSQAALLGSGYFQKGLQSLFQMELLSRTASYDLSMLFDFWRASLPKRGKR